MENQDKSESFRFAYSAKEQEELRKIRQKYAPKEENKMEQLRRLDQNVTKKEREKIAPEILRLTEELMK